MRKLLLLAALLFAWPTWVGAQQVDGERAAVGLQIGVGDGPSRSGILRGIVVLRPNANVGGVFSYSRIDLGLGQDCIPEPPDAYRCSLDPSLLMAGVRARLPGTTSVAPFIAFSAGGLFRDEGPAENRRSLAGAGEIGLRFSLGATSAATVSVEHLRARDDGFRSSVGESFAVTSVVIGFELSLG